MLRLLIVFLCCFSSLCAAQDLYEIPAGVSIVDLTGDNSPEILLKTWRENYNAHGYYVLMFLEGALPEKVSFLQDMQSKSDEERLSFDGTLKNIGIENKDGSIDTTLRTSQGADCMLIDYRLIIDKSKIYLIKGTRDLGDSFTDSASITFDFYKLTHNIEGIAGSPAYNFIYYKRIKTDKVYCDVNTAFEEEEVGLIR